jgi:hypothetical protein
MDLGNRNPARPPEAAAAPAHHGPSDQHFAFTKPTVASKTLVVLLIVVSLIVIGSFGATVLGKATANTSVKSKQYQALFLTNGQVYFGHLSKVDSGYVKLSDIYYLQVQQQVQPKDNSQAQQPQISLAKLGGELHGPEDVMYVQHDQVLFWENLKDDGKVVQAIKQFQQTKK